MIDAYTHGGRSAARPEPCFSAGVERAARAVSGSGVSGVSGVSGYSETSEPVSE